VWSGARPFFENSTVCLKIDAIWPCLGCGWGGSVPLGVGLFLVVLWVGFFLGCELSGFWFPAFGWGLGVGCFTVGVHLGLV
jgi:hypothetical protein